ncbi:hypothetical protein BDM02DRAFT_3192806 [Thelephora ganbajun]|uniref:Uncharacterized protein n=1 Tax=Thelephora ganbajun TaxID=370292 RepID=A0ACB6YZT3_THEGA|nr:hypothetical protein BDM02DRAFT_3192806 [Thelephora ganbajun]
MVCTGSSIGNEDNCDCKQFVPKKSKGHRCQSCGHRHTSHINAASSPLELEEGEAVPTKPHGPNYAERVYNSSKVAGIFMKARKESLQGYRPSPPSNPKGKTKAKRLASRVPSQNRDMGPMKIGRIVFFPCGDQNIYRFRFPTINFTALEPWVRAGLAVEADPKAEDGIIFQLEWGSKQFHAFLRRLFPKLFNYLDGISPGLNALSDEPDDIGTRKINYTLPYALLQKDRKKYHLVDATHPTALTYREYTSNEKGTSGFRSKGIFLVIKEPIPQETLNSWFAPSNAPIVPISQPTTTGNKRKRLGK